MSVAKGCDSPKQMLYGKAQEHNLNTGRAVEFQCDKGYNLVGDSLVVCMGGNTWSSAFPTCQREKHACRIKGAFNWCDMNKWIHYYLPLLVFPVMFDFFLYSLSTQSLLQRLLLTNSCAFGKRLQHIDHTVQANAQNCLEHHWVSLSVSQHSLWQNS